MFLEGPFLILTCCQNLCVRKLVDHFYIHSHLASSSILKWVVSWKQTNLLATGSSEGLPPTRHFGREGVSNSVFMVPVTGSWTKSPSRKFYLNYASNKTLNRKSHKYILAVNILAVKELHIIYLLCHSQDPEQIFTKMFLKIFLH